MVAVAVAVALGAMVVAAAEAGAPSGAVAVGAAMVVAAVAAAAAMAVAVAALGVADAAVTAVGAAAAAAVTVAGVAAAAAAVAGFDSGRSHACGGGTRQVWTYAPAKLTAGVRRPGRLGLLLTFMWLAGGIRSAGGQHNTLCPSVVEAWKVWSYVAGRCGHSSRNTALVDGRQGSCAMQKAVLFGWWHVDKAGGI